jgi:hypothetical protein
MGVAMTGQFLGRAAVESAGRLLHIAAGDLAGLYLATVLSLIGKTRRRRSPTRGREQKVDDDPFCALHVGPDLEGVWEKYHRA